MKSSLLSLSILQDYAGLSMDVQAVSELFARGVFRKSKILKDVGKIKKNQECLLVWYTVEDHSKLAQILKSK